METARIVVTVLDGFAKKCSSSLQTKLQFNVILISIYCTWWPWSICQQHCLHLNIKIKNILVCYVC